METKEYQEQAGRTLIDDSAVIPLTARQHRIVWNAIGLAGETLELLEHKENSAEVAINAGKVLEVVKKAIFHGHGMGALEGLGWKYILPLLRALQDVAAETADLPDYKFFQKIRAEIGDVLWYVSALCTCLEIDMAELLPDAGPLGPIMEANIEKLKLRFPHGWDVEDSKTRRDLQPA